MNSRPYSAHRNLRFYSMESTDIQMDLRRLVYNLLDRFERRPDLLCLHLSYVLDRLRLQQTVPEIVDSTFECLHQCHSTSNYSLELSMNKKKIKLIT